MSDLDFLVDIDRRRERHENYARKHAELGKYSIALGYEQGIVVVAHNARTGEGIEKVREVHHHIAVVGSGRPHDMEEATEHAILEAGVTEVQFSAQDVLAAEAARNLGRYATVLFASPEPMGGILLVAGIDDSKNMMYRVTYDGEVTPSENFASIGGKLSDEGSNWIEDHRRSEYTLRPLSDAILFGVDCLSRAYAEQDHGSPKAMFKSVLKSGEHIEVVVLDRSIKGANKFAPISNSRLRHECAPMTSDELKAVFASYVRE